MLQITTPETEYYDNAKNEFVYIKETKLQLEHSLISLSKWESKWHKPFLSKKEKSLEENLDYIKCMTITQNVNPEVYGAITNMKEIDDYIENTMTATVIPKAKPGKINNEQITAELIYYWMIALEIPSEYRKWHLNQLICLIQLCNIKNSPPEKMSRSEIIERNRELNEARKKQLNTKG